MPNPSRSEPLPAQPDRGRSRAALARKWTYLLSGVVVVPLDSEELGRELCVQLDILCDAVRDEDIKPIRQVGERLVALGYVGEAGMRCTLDVLGKGMLALPEFQPMERFAERILLAQSALACGFLAAAQRAVFDQQESMHLSLLKAVRDAKWNLKESEARFDEVITSSSSGVLIVGLDGRVQRANAAAGVILGLTQSELTGVELAELVHPEAERMLRDGLRALLDGTKDRLRQTQRLLRKDGDVARVALTVSLLRGADDQPSHYVAVIEDGTELMLLQSELSRQSLHDMLTGLPNRQFFGTRLEAALGAAGSAHGVTLFHLDLDAFGLLCNSLGRRAGERLLVHVAQRLRAVLAKEKTIIARFDGDEFGILVENTAGTPPVATIMAEINAELAEPFYVDGHGLAASVSAGIVHRPSPDIDPAELLRAADQTLRRAKTGRRGQWELFDPAADAEDRYAHGLAVSMPGAWENGQITVRYRPVTRLADGRLAGVEAVLHWEHPEEGPLGHARCTELAERTGLILPLGDWLLRTAAGQAHWWRQRRGFTRPLAVGLTAHQAADAHLVARVLQILDDTRLPPRQLMIGMPVGALTIPGAATNLANLAELGVRTVLVDFGLAPDDLAAVHTHGVHFVRIAARLADHQASYVAALVGEVDARVVVDGISTAAQAAWWLAAGADGGTGSFIGSAVPPGEFPL
ncbi:PAS domain S-box-containing protein/diguanylate cyclase (GGDEF) domain-containing protein [Amycolatopsis xylanica]|uniref:PAS domain S-box-containing protein/diguanylate cyclase (GGDEF) domain-containing protein n=1 Tax=Amycolatopsis xylanica TaxID=589385 RepID=A0A1H3PAS1_9PSEU|nr:EAL domain-containing protein [Amycolatopsis xylanica]SDY98226.1 PAS domain S-box-containing protein/diguanylate cyclase (GGDEF) domain-containing protein [Amycolatopsis xylanica]